MKDYLITDWDYNSSKLVDLYDELPLWAAPFGLKLLENISYKRAIKALDIGFGAGFPLTELAMRLDKNSTVYGIDPWEAAVDRAENKIEFYGIKNVQIIRGIAEAIPLANNEIDLIISNNGLNNVSDLEQSLSECSRIIKKGGQFIQSLNLNESMIEFYEVMEIVLTDLNLNSSLIDMRKHVFEKRKPLNHYLDMIRSNGFTIEKVIHEKFEYQFVDGTTMLNHHFIRLAFLDGWKRIVPENRKTEIFKLIEQELNKRSQLSGTLKLSIPFVVIDAQKI